MSKRLRKRAIVFPVGRIVFGFTVLVSEGVDFTGDDTFFLCFI